MTDRAVTPGFVARAARFVPVREGWSRVAGENGGPYRALPMPGNPGIWVVVDGRGRICWERDTGQVGDSRQEVAEAAAAAWNHEGGFTAKHTTSKRDAR